MKYVVTMTSWTGRIQYVADSIKKLMSIMPIKLDKFYLWLAEAEFPRKEHDLPTSLLKVIKQYDIDLRWTKENEYCFKRWHVYPEHFHDTVICVDDDITFTSQQIEFALSAAKFNKHSIINLAHLYYSNVFNHSMHKELIHWFDDKPSYYVNFCGQCIVPPDCFPVEVMTKELLDIRMKVCNKCDETWLNPFLVKNNITVYNNFMLNPTQQEYEKETALHNVMDVKLENNQFNFRDAQLFVVLNSVPELKRHWLLKFPGYMTTEQGIADMMAWQSKFPDFKFERKHFDNIPIYSKSY